MSFHDLIIDNGKLSTSLAMKTMILSSVGYGRAGRSTKTINVWFTRAPPLRK